MRADAPAAAKKPAGNNIGGQRRAAGRVMRRDRAWGFSSFRGRITLAKKAQFVSIRTGAGVVFSMT